jgi:hypothetical protein
MSTKTKATSQTTTSAANIGPVTLRAIAERVNNNLVEFRRMTLNKAIEIGTDLLEARNNLGGTKKLWREWVKENLQCSQRTASRFLYIAKNAAALQEKAKEVGELSFNGIERVLEQRKERKPRKAKAKPIDMDPEDRGGRDGDGAATTGATGTEPQFKGRPTASVKAYTELEYAIDHWVPQLNAEDVERIRAHFNKKVEARLAQLRTASLH